MARRKFGLQLETNNNFSAITTREEEHNTFIDLEKVEIGNEINSTTQPELSNLVLSARLIRFGTVGYGNEPQSVEFQLDKIILWVNVAGKDNIDDDSRCFSSCIHVLYRHVRRIRFCLQPPVNQIFLDLLPKAAIEIRKCLNLSATSLVSCFDPNSNDIRHQLVTFVLGSIKPEHIEKFQRVMHSVAELQILNGRRIDVGELNAIDSVKLMQSVLGIMFKEPKATKKRMNANRVILPTKKMKMTKVSEENSELTGHSCGDKNCQMCCLIEKYRKAGKEPI